MKRFIVISTINRSRVDPPEPLDEEGQKLANDRLALEEQWERMRKAPASASLDREYLRRRA